MRRQPFIGASAVALFLLLTTFSVQALILSAPPRESAQDGARIYGPLAAYLSTLLGEEVTYEHPGNWLIYQRDMRADKYDIVFDGPHFISWRIAKTKHEALLRLPGALQFVLVARKDDTTVNTMDDLIGKTMCGIAPPNLSTLSMLARYPNPVRQPTIRGIPGGMGGVYKSLLEEGTLCSASPLRTTFFKKKLTDEQRDKVKVLYTTKAMPEQGISVSTRVSAENRAKLREALMKNPDAIKAAEGVVKRFGPKNATAFIATNNAEYADYNSLLEGVIFGW